ncbi:unnamed protein product [Victoria cruziana]
MHLSENEGIEGNTFVVTGGSGFVGSALCLELVRRGAREVRSLDIRGSSPWTARLKDKGVICIPGDVSKKEDVEKAFRGANCVFHLASYGMSGKEMLQTARVDEVNMNGTCHVLDVCFEFGIQRLVYMSTYNVVFGGNEIINGNEMSNYFPVDSHVDPYSRSKTLAEQLVLKSNGRRAKKGGRTLYTCAIRSAAIYGPGEERHFPRILSVVKSGIFRFRIGEETIRTDWVYVDNLVHALILASMGLLDDLPGKEGNPVASGQPYFISDGVPVNTFEFLRPLILSLGYDFPSHKIQVSHILILAHFFFAIYSILYPCLQCSWLPQPMLLPAEVHKVGVTHYFSILKARQELGYEPLVSPSKGMAETIAYWQEMKRKTVDGPAFYVWFFCLTGIFTVICSAAVPYPYLGPFECVRTLNLFVFRSLLVVQVVAAVASALHVLEAGYAWCLARRVDPANANHWFWQTFLLGFFSLRYLLKKRSR